MPDTAELSRYNKFKDRTNMMFIAFPVLRLLAYYKLSHTWCGRSCGTALILRLSVHD